MSTYIRFETNVPVVAALKFTEGLKVEGQYGDQREADAGPRQERGAGSVEHEGSMPRRVASPCADRPSAGLSLVVCWRTRSADSLRA